METKIPSATVAVCGMVIKPLGGGGKELMGIPARAAEVVASPWNWAGSLETGMLQDFGDVGRMNCG